VRQWTRGIPSWERWPTYGSAQTDHAGEGPGALRRPWCPRLHGVLPFLAAPARQLLPDALKPGFQRVRTTSNPGFMAVRRPDLGSVRGAGEPPWCRVPDGARRASGPAPPAPAAAGAQVRAGQSGITPWAAGPAGRPVRPGAPGAPALYLREIA